MGCILVIILHPPKRQNEIISQEETWSNFPFQHQNFKLPLVQENASGSFLEDLVASNTGVSQK